MDFENKKVLATGSDGFIGSHLIERMLKENCQVKAFVYYNSFNSLGWLDSFPKDKLKDIEIFAGDVRDLHGVRTAVKDMDIVFHLAALISIPYSFHSPDNYVDTNIKGTLNVMQASRELNVLKVVHTSTSEVYGTARSVPITEEHPLQGQSPYSATEIAADQIAMSFYTSFETLVTIIRLFNAFGPRQSARAVIPTVIVQLLNGNKEIKLGSLHPTRDLNYVEDTCKGFLALSKCDDAVVHIAEIVGGPAHHLRLKRFF